jgi:hypothetical protein
MCGMCDIRFKPMQMEDSAYPFLAFSGIPSLSFRFVSQEVRGTLSGLDVFTDGSITISNTGVGNLDRSNFVCLYVVGLPSLRYLF